MKWTDAQEKVIRSRGKNVLVSAAAGSGKTAVLTERILELLKEGEELKSFLVFTFTRSSASDMKEKLRKKLSHEVSERGDPHLKKQLRGIHACDISTIHSFCSRLCREYFFALELDPAFTIGSQDRLDTMDREVLDEIFEEEYLKRDPIFLELSRIFSGARGDRRFKELIISLRTFLEQKPQPRTSAEEIVQRTGEESFWRERFDTYIEEKKRQMRGHLEEALLLCADTPLQELLMEDIASLAVFDGFGDLGWRNFLTGKKVAAEEEKETIKALRNRAREIGKQLAKDLAPRKSFEELFEDHLALEPRLRKLLEISLEYSERSFAARREAAILSFSDLEMLSLQLLKSDEIREEIRGKHEYVFVDEYQDTSEIQEALILAVSRENNCFMVGDIKQSIYRFREAKPEIFLEKYHRYKEESEFSERIDLSTNFRSASPIIDAINAVFETIMLKDFGGIEYDAAARLVYGNRTLDAHTEPIEVMLSEGGEGQKEETELLMIADKVLELHAMGHPFGDIVILMRSPAAYTPYAPKIFREKGIPLFIDSAQAYLGALEVELMLSGLKVVDNVHLDVPLLSVLRLPAFGFTEQELYDIIQEHPAPSFHKAFLADWESEKKAHFLTVLEDLRRKSRFLSIEALLREIYHALEMEHFLHTLENPAQRLSNVRLLSFYARSFEETGGMGISGYLRYLENVRELRSDYAPPKIRSEDSQLVRIMSTHRSKGLEFPVVILGGLSRNYNEREHSSFVLASEEAILMDFYDVEKLERQTHFFRRFLSAASRSASRQEEIRLLYVAMSRAQHRLILSAYVPSREAFFAEYESTLFTPLPERKTHLQLLVEALRVKDGEITAPGFVLSEPVSAEERERQKTKLTASGKIAPPFVLERSSVRSKYSVSELTHVGPLEPEPLLPLEPGKLSAKERGILFHKALQWLDFERLKREDNLYEQLREMEESGILVGFEEHALLERFLKTDEGKLLIEKAPYLKKEVPFTLKKIWQGEEILVQGVIDLLILEEECTIIDYKTDRSLTYAPQYLAQVGIYQEAVETILGKRVQDALVTFVRLGSVLRRERP